MPATQPDLVLRRTRLVPIGPGAAAPSGPVDVRLSGGRVAEVGEHLDRPRGTEELDADGRWLTPGLWDQHVHLGQWALASQRLDLTLTRSRQQVLDQVTQHLHDIDELPIVGWGHRPATWSEPPTTEVLDELAGDRPVVLIAGDGHHAWLNRAAMRALSLPEREGMVSESEWFATYPRLVDLVGTDGTAPEAYVHVMHEAAKRGVTGLVDLEFDQAFSAWPGRVSSGAGLLRVRVGAYVDTLDEFAAAGMRTGQLLPDCGDLVTMGPLKIISDGSLNTRTAWCCSAYAGGGHGAANISAEGLRAALDHARRSELEVAVHAIGDAAVGQALDAFAATGVRGSVEHAQLVRREDSRRMAALGVRASVQPAHLLDDRALTEVLWPDRTERCFALRWFVDDGVEVVLGSDAPVAPLDPWLAIAAAVHRGAGDDDPWHPEQSLTAAEALAASTDGRGTVAVGDLADLALLDTDPLPSGTPRDQAAQLTGIRSDATWVAGRLVHGSL
ncbi:amidohydrolase [Nocardioides scoriae]|uniref:amidohydrolase n=1 Tax=Nocardioides scoriae TaxID=642780 RepID=UPI000B84395B|nr:amidohydrolase family protein [Nocardioides scoriae]